jgi:predicted O-methyltransferase YrrM
MNPTEAFLNDVPKLHSWDGGATWNTGGFGVTELGWIIRAIGERFGPGARIAETGAGCSTLAFLLAAPHRVHSIAVEGDIFDRIDDHAARLGVSTLPLERYVGRSELLLPKLTEECEQRGTPLDLALLDGGHGWPTCFVDFCYLNAALRKGGLLMVDDLHLHSVKELARFLSEEPRFRLVERFDKTLIFEKLEDFRFLPDFGDQPYVMRRTEQDAAEGRRFEL